MLIKSHSCPLIRHFCCLSHSFLPLCAPPFCIIPLLTFAIAAFCSFEELLLWNNFLEPEITEDVLEHKNNPSRPTMFFFYKCVLCTQLEPSENEWSVIADWSVYSSSGALKSFPRPGKVRFSAPFKNISEGSFRHKSKKDTFKRYRKLHERHQWIYRNRMIIKIN